MARILVVDDEEQIRGLLASFFTRTGFEVTLASGGEEAVRLLLNKMAEKRLGTLVAMSQLGLLQLCMGPCVWGG